MERGKLTRPQWWSDIQPRPPARAPGLPGQRCSGVVLCVPAMHRCSPQLLLDRELGRGAHTGCRGGLPTTLRPETWHSYFPDGSDGALWGGQQLQGQGGLGRCAAREPSGRS